MSDGRKAPRNRGNASPISAARMAAGLTQGQLAEKMGCTQKDISRWERGVCKPGVDKLVKIAGELGCTVMDLIEM